MKYTGLDLASDDMFVNTIRPDRRQDDGVPVWRDDTVLASIHSSNEMVTWQKNLEIAAAGAAK